MDHLDSKNVAMASLHILHMVLPSAHVWQHVQPPKIWLLFDH
jgi:hypothetical protein